VATRAEIKFLKDEFDKNRGALLPDDPGTKDGINSIETLEKAIDDYWKRSQTQVAADASAEERSTFEQNRAIWQTYYDALADITHWAGFIWFHRKVTGGIAAVLRIGLGATVCILAFAWAANPPKAESSRGDTIVIKETAKWSPPLKAKFFEPLYFDPGRFELSKTAMEQIDHARDFLREHTDEALLVSAYTDTMGNRALNGELAHNRAQAVVGALRDAGGIAASRIFVNELPLTDLPVVTGPQIDTADNRSVWLAGVPMPQRESAESGSQRQ
jgi:outer membrane protein OmpA-like peptidoglycan-associated protein